MFSKLFIFGENIFFKVAKNVAIFDLLITPVNKMPGPSKSSLNSQISPNLVTLTNLGSLKYTVCIVLWENYTLRHLAKRQLA
jgi:hypothetical protein